MRTTLRTSLVPVALSLSALALLAGCGDSGSKEPAAPAAPASRPGHILIDHILIGVRSPSFQQGKRDAAEAKSFAYSLTEKLKAGGDWDALKKEHSEDGSPGRPGGPYGLADRGVRPDPGEMPREGMVPGFGDVGFHLAVGQIDVAMYDPVKSPFGYHIIKRIR